MQILYISILKSKRKKEREKNCTPFLFYFAMWLHDGETCLYTHNVQGTNQCKPMKLQKPMIIQTKRHDESPTWMNNSTLEGSGHSSGVGFHNCYIIITVLHTTNIYKNLTPPNETYNWMLILYKIRPILECQRWRENKIGHGHHSTRGSLSAEELYSLGFIK